MNHQITSRINALLQRDDAHLIRGGGKGIEKESLRITPSGNVAQSPHPRSLGSTLTHSAITTDYSEALLELITPPLEQIPDAYDYLKQIHQFIYHNLENDELLWGASMPCIVGGAESIPIAWYGESNVGMMKHVYRRGLDVRYGRIMQAISGIHFNYSVPEAFWPVIQELDEDNRPLPEIINSAYMGLARNILRYEWLLTYLFGSSPAFCKSFMAGHDAPFQEFDRSTYYEPYATSLRMSDIGYKNNQPDGLSVSYNSLDEYIADLQRAIQTLHPPYEEKGVMVDGFFQQLNANILQIENEYYSSVRPKQPIRSGEKPTSALRDRGIRYIELRAVDVVTAEPLGISHSQLYFLETFMLFCLLNESPPIDATQQQKNAHNQDETARNGRAPNLTLYQNGHSPTLQDWGMDLLEQMEPICAILDDEDKKYSSALSEQREALRDPDRTPSAQTLAEMSANKESFYRYAMRKSKEHQQTILATPLDAETLKTMKAAAAESLQKQAEIEAADDLSFEEYLTRYFETV